MDLNDRITCIFVTIDDEIKIACQRLHVSRLRHRSPTRRWRSLAIVAKTLAAASADPSADSVEQEHVTHPLVGFPGRRRRRKTLCGSPFEAQNTVTKPQTP